MDTENYKSVYQSRCLFLLSLSRQLPLLPFPPRPPLHIKSSATRKFGKKGLFNLTTKNTFKLLTAGHLWGYSPHMWWMKWKVLSCHNVIMILHFSVNCRQCVAGRFPNVKPQLDCLSMCDAAWQAMMEHCWFLQYAPYPCFSVKTSIWKKCPDYWSYGWYQWEINDVPVVDVSAEIYEIWKCL